MASSPGGQVIGRVSVKVLPDTSDFRRQAEKALDRIEKTLKLTIGTKVDMSGASREYLEELRKINQRNRNMDSRKIRFHTTISTDGMVQAISTARRRLQEKADQSKIKFKIDGAEVSGDIKLELNQEAADKAARDLKDWAKDHSPIKIKVEPDFSSTGAAITNARLGYLTRPRTVSIIPDLNNAAVAKVGAALAALSGARVLNSMFEKLGNTLRNLDKSVPIIGSVATAIAGLGAVGITSASNMFALASSLAQIGPAGLLVPGLLGGIAVGMGATIAAFKDFNKIFPQVKGQLSAMQDTISSNFWDKAKAPFQDLIDNLLPKFSAGIAKTGTALGGFFGSFATDLSGKLGPIMGQMFTDLNSSIAKAGEHTKSFANIIGVLGKVGTSYLPELADWFGKVSDKFSAWLTKNEESGQLTEWISLAIDNLKELGGVIKNLFGIFAGLGRAAQEAGGSTLAMLNDTLERIHNTVDSPGFQKGMVDVFKSAHTAMKTIADTSGPAVENLFIQLGKTLTTVLPLAGKIIGTAMKAIADALAQPAVQQGITTMFNGILAAVTALAPAMAPVGKALGALMQVVGAMLTAFGPLIAAVLTPLANAFAQLAPMIIPVVQLLSGALLDAVNMIAPILMKMVPVIGEALTGAFKALSGILPGIMTTMGQMLAAVLPLVGVLVSSLAPILPIIAQLFAMIYAAVAPLIIALASALAPILPVLSAAFQVVLAALQPIIETALKIITAVIAPLLPMLSGIIQDFLPKLADALKRLLEAIQPVLDALLAVVNFLMPILVPVLQFIIALLADSLVAAVNGVALVFEGLVEIVTGVWDIIVGVLKMAWGLILMLLGQGTSTFTEGWSQFWSGIWNFVKGIWDVILGAFRTFLSIGVLGTAVKVLKGIGLAFKAGWTAVVNFGKSAWSSITGGFSSFGSWIAGRASAMMSSVGGFFSRGWSSIKESATSALSSLVSSIGTWLAKAITTIGGLPGKAKAALGDLGSLLLNAGKQIVQGLIRGIESMIGSVKSKLSKLTDMIPDWKGPLPKDKVLLYGAGKAIITGLIKGLESQFDNVKKSLGGLTDQIAKAKLSGALTARLKKDQKHLNSLLSSWEKIDKKLDDAKKKLADLKTAKADYAANIAQKIVDAANVTNMEGGFSGIISSLKMQVEQAKRFGDVLKKLKSLGLNSEMFDQLAQAGPEAGMAAAEALANAGKAGVDQVNALEKQLADAAGKVGKTASEVMFDNGIHMAEGLVKGLEKQASAIENQMLKIAKSMTDAIKKALGIHSPSRVMAALGVWVGKGLAKGLDKGRSAVLSTMKVMALDVSGYDIQPPAVAQLDVSSAVASAVDGNGTSGGVTKVLNYYAAPGSSLNSEEDLFAASNRARMVGW
ncbi:tail length tape measure protein [Streptomyces phage Endor2]|uniref:Tape measure protein n=1 Tax=Streptomyces phage Endor2 TaxID=2740182 RepID=A0A7G4AX23_9CAUD|nr:tail length tape measure protein [Streptomyces phage Endor2]QMP84563.1 tape measure protein [Streptomyces phage Endor2]